MYFFRIDSDSKILWVYLRSTVDLHWRLYLYAINKSYTHKELTSSDDWANSGNMQVCSARLQ